VFLKVYTNPPSVFRKLLLIVRIRTFRTAIKKPGRTGQMYCCRVI